jgi:hypothetical protein
MADLIRGGPSSDHRSARTWTVVGVLAVLACAVVAGFMLAGRQPSSAPVPHTTKPRAAPTCTGTDITAAVRAFVDAWNSHDPGLLAAALTPTAELDMSEKRQRARPPAVGGGFTATQGITHVVHFAEHQWQRGEQLTYAGVRPFLNGANAVDMVARFDGNKRQRMSEAKFAYDCSQAGFSHIVIVAREIAR